MKKIIIITGANRGLGKALVDIALSDEQSLVCSLSRSLHEEHSKLIVKNFLFFKTDLSEKFPTDFSDVFREHIDSESVIYFFNNAGCILPIKKVGKLEMDGIENSINVNIRFPVHMINFLLHNFSKNKIVLINITSGASHNPIPYWSLYNAAKSYLSAFFATLEKENVGNTQLEIHNWDPGVLDTGMQKDIRESIAPNQEYFTSLKQNNKLKRPEDAALEIFKLISLQL